MLLHQEVKNEREIEKIEKHQKVKNEIGLIRKKNLVAIEAFGVISKNLKNAKGKIDCDN